MNAPVKRRKRNNFLDNKQFCEALIDYKQKVNLAKERGEDKPVIPRYIGKSFLDIADDFRKTGGRNNFTLNHLAERIKFYVDEDFEYRVTEVPLNSFVG